MPKFRDLTGQKFGKLTVISFSRDVKSGKRYRKYWNCICDCGNIKEVRTDLLTSGNTTSCGCKHKEISYKNLIPGGQKYEIVNKRLRSIWNGIKNRTLNPEIKCYYRYGGKGIGICEDWLDFNKFAKWSLENGYRDDLSIDRINNKGDYEPSNCRWVTNKIQCNNRTTNILVEYKGKKITLMQLSEITGINYGTIISRYKRGDRGEELTREINVRKISKITKEDVKEIRQKREQGKTFNELSKEYGVSAGTISNIVKRRTWGYVE